MGRVRFYTKDRKVRPIIDSHPKYGTMSKGTTNLGIPQKFNREKIANLKAEKMKEAEKQKGSPQADRKDAKIPDSQNRSNEPQRLNEVQKPSEQSKASSPQPSQNVNQQEVQQEMMKARLAQKPTEGAN